MAKRQDYDCLKITLKTSEHTHYETEEDYQRAISGWVEMIINKYGTSDYNENAV